MAAQKSKYFAKGSGHARQYGQTILFDWNGKNDGSAFVGVNFLDGKPQYRRNGIHYKSFAALLRGVEAEHQQREGN